MDLVAKRDIIRVMLEDTSCNIYTDQLIYEALELTEIYHILATVQILKNYGNKMPSLVDIDEIVKKIIESNKVNQGEHDLQKNKKTYT